MLRQRFELVATVGGFSEEKATTLPTFHNEERDVHVQIGLSEQFARAQGAFSDFADVVGSQLRNGLRSLIFDEAMKNVMYHGFPYIEKRCDASAQSLCRSLCRLTIEAQTTETVRSITFVLTFNDHTPVFERSLVPDAKDDEHIDQATGRGILLMESLGVAISQIPQVHGKTVVYAWTETEELSKEDDSVST